MSAALKTMRTPGTARAREESIAPMRPRARGQRDQLDVQLAGQMDVGDVELLAGDAPAAAAARRRLADLDTHWSTTCAGRSRTDCELAVPASACASPAAVTSTASKIW